MVDRRVECRALLATCRPAWVAGHGDQAWAALDEAGQYVVGDDGLQLEVLSMRAGLHLLAEQLPQALRCAEQASMLGHQLLDGGTGLDHATAEALADARVTVASMTVDGSHPASSMRLIDALVVLDQVAYDPSLTRTTTAARAVNNALNLRIHALQHRLHTIEGRVEAWVRISEARTLLHGWPDQGTVLRQAVDVGMTCGQWERAWSNAQEQIADTTQRNELIAVLSKAAVLAWHANRREEVRGLGERARSLSVAVDHPWVRTYAYLGHVAAAAAGAGSLEAALQAYARCTSRAGHATRPHRAWQAAQIALESGHSPDDVEEFLAATLPDGLGDLEQHVRVLIADARRHDVEPAAALDLLQPSRSGPDRARVHLALARTYRRQGRPTASALELERARALLDTWPGWLHDQVEHETALVQQPVLATPAQHRVLALTAEGHSNLKIADALDLSERTVAVHIAAMLRANGLASRTALAARHLRAAAHQAKRTRQPDPGRDS